LGPDLIRRQEQGQRNRERHNNEFHGSDYGPLGPDSSLTTNVRRPSGASA
jgi:hypothetical protein